MLSLEYIEQKSREAAIEAAQEKKHPFIIEAEDIGHLPPFPFPQLGDYLPDGWQRVELNEEDRGVYFNAYFVDSSGLSSPDEPALLVGEFIDLLEVGYGYAITEVGKFQVRVGKYKWVH